MNTRASIRTFFFFVFLILVIGIFLYSSISFVHNYHRLSKEKALNAKTHKEVLLTPLNASSASPKVSTTSTAISLIRNWMTFDYINRLFNIPPSYFESKLDVADTNYPRITIRSLAKKYNSEPTFFLTHIQSLVTEYLHSH